MARNPADISVSFYMITSHGAKVPFTGGRASWTIGQWITDKDVGIEGIVRFFNDWAERREEPKRFMLLRYEDLVERTFETFSRFLKFCKHEFSEEQIRTAIERGQFSRMQAREVAGKRFFQHRRRNVADPQARFFRKGCINAWREDVPEALHDYIQKELLKLDPFYGYDFTRGGSCLAR